MQLITMRDLFLGLESWKNLSRGLWHIYVSTAWHGSFEVTPDIFVTCREKTTADLCLVMTWNASDQVFLFRPHLVVDALDVQTRYDLLEFQNVLQHSVLDYVKLEQDFHGKILDVGAIKTRNLPKEYDTWDPSFWHSSLWSFLKTLPFIRYVDLSATLEGQDVNLLCMKPIKSFQTYHTFSFCCTHQDACDPIEFKFHKHTPYSIAQSLEQGSFSKLFRTPRGLLSATNWHDLQKPM